jgi:hypothetical protein
VVPLILLLVVAAAVGAFLLLEGLPGGGGGGNGRGSRGEGGPLRLVEATAYDPLGDGGEHDEVAGDAIDGDDSTAWTTEGYTTSDLGGAKEGVGLVLAIRGEAAVSNVGVLTEAPGWSFEVYAGGSPDGLESSDPLSSGGDTSFTADSESSLELDEPVEARYVLIWITELVEADGYRALVNEVDLFGAGG